MPENTQSEKIYIGADVSKATIDLFNDETGEHQTIKNDKAAIRRFLKTIKTQTVIVFEATGGYERKLSDLIETMPMLERLRVHPSCVKSFARALGTKAKTDKIDAYMLAKAARTMKDSFVDTTPPKHVQALRDRLTYQRQLEAMLHAEECRLKMKDLPTDILSELKKHVSYLKSRIAYIKAGTKVMIREYPELLSKYDRLKDVKGIGAVIATTVLAYLPELGRLGRKEVAALAGLAPHTRQSGTKTSRAFTTGGRKELRRVLYIGALVGSQHNPVLKAFYEKLCKAGRPKMVALIATARKLLIHINANEKKFLNNA